jgi:hypothetical protein
MKLSGTITLKAILLVGLAAPIFIQSAYGQQEVNPTWYNPWPDAPNPAATPTPTRIADKDAKTTDKDRAVTREKKNVQEPVRTAEALRSRNSLTSNPTTSPQCRSGSVRITALGFV